MLEKLRQMEENYHAMQEKMMDPAVVGDNQQYAQLMREYKHMQPIIEKNIMSICRHRTILQKPGKFWTAKKMPNCGKWHRQSWNRARNAWTRCTAN